MSWVLLLGDLAVMAFLACIAVWVCMPSNRDKMQEAARIPLHEGEEETPHV